MRTDWDYSELADSYLKRPAYAEAALQGFLRVADIVPRMRACDIGAGTANLTVPLLRCGLHVVAVEPNETMRDLGMKRTGSNLNVSWVDGCGEFTGQLPEDFDLVTFGSSFNVVDRQKALREAARILRPRGWFACVWNHRDVNDPLQQAIEQTIRSQIQDYTYGVRREDQTAIIKESGLFSNIQRVEARIVHSMDVSDCLEAWRSHATLRRQAGENFEKILDDIGRLIGQTRRSSIEVPYTTRVWLAQKTLTEPRP